MTNQFADIRDDGLTSIVGTDKYRPYPAYKDSGAEWLGEVPAHWEVKQLRWAITFQRGHDLPSDDREEGDVPVVSSSGISSMHSKAIARAPGIVTGRCGTIGQFYVINQSYWPLNTALYSIDLHGNEPRFLLYMLIHMSPLFLLHSIKSAVPAVDRKDVHADHTAVPHLSEQRAIAAFLDRETAKIDDLVSKKERLIELLQEKRTTLISDAVTKGLDPDVPLKDSGVEWLGEIPAHWEVKQLKRLAFMQAGTAITGDDIGAEGDYPVFGGNGVRGYTSSFTHEGEFPLVGRQGALCGCVNFATGKFWASEHAVVLRPNAGVNPKWLAQLLQAMSLNQYSQSAAQPGLSVETIGSIAAPAALKTEQRAIAAFLDHETAQIDALVAKIRKAIDLLKEQRTALISAVVTGKIDVREAMA